MALFDPCRQFHLIEQGLVVVVVGGTQQFLVLFPIILRCSYEVIIFGI